MSADNGIYILKTKAVEPTPESDFEYRVAHTTNIEDIYWDAEGACYREDGRFTPEIAFEYFGKAPVFTSPHEAWEHAKELAKTITILEYGIGMLEHGDQVFQEFTPEELERFHDAAERVLEEHRRSREEQIQRDLEARTMRVPPAEGIDVIAGMIEFIDEDTGMKVRAQLKGKVSVETLEEVEVLKVS